MKIKMNVEMGKGGKITLEKGKEYISPEYLPLHFARSLIKSRKAIEVKEKSEGKKKIKKG